MPQAAEMLKGAAGKLVGIGSAWPSAKALARRYISLRVAPLASIAAATTAQLRISVVIDQIKIDCITLATHPLRCDAVNRPWTEHPKLGVFARCETMLKRLRWWCPQNLP